MFWPFTVWINCSSDLKIFANSRPSASNFKSFSRSLEEFFLKVGQNNFGNKIPFFTIWKCPKITVWSLSGDFQVSGHCLKAILWLSNDRLMTPQWLYSKFTSKYMDSFDIATNSKSGLTIIWIFLVQISQTFNLFWWSESHWSILRFFKDQARASDPVTSKLDFYAGNAFLTQFFNH